ncbi:MAG: POTRA domain-containing protein, partial [Bacteroidota bacterium]
MESSSFAVPVEASADDRATGFFRFVLTAFLLWTHIAAANSQEVITVRALELTGNTVIPTHQLLPLLRLRPGSSFEKAVLQEDVKMLKQTFVNE